MPIFAILICLGCFAAALLQMDHYLPQLSGRMAVRFDLDGRPIGWMSKDGFTVYYLCLLAFVVGSFVAVGLLAGRIPPRLLGIPHRDYWLAPERRAESLRYLKEFHLWTGAFAGLFIVGMMEMVFKINLDDIPRLDNRLFYSATGAFCFTVLVAVLIICWRFKKPAEKS
ncbi:MAG: hypothetical protein ACK4PK_07480 [Alphaproteobacteria bacterium]